MAEELAQVVSIAGVFHFAMDENVSGEQSHFSTHVDSIYDLSNMVILRLPWAAQTSVVMIMCYNYNYVKFSRQIWYTTGPNLEKCKT